jgi:hypothetical protein
MRLKLFNTLRAMPPEAVLTLFPRPVVTTCASSQSRYCKARKKHWHARESNCTAYATEARPECSKPPVAGRVLLFQLLREFCLKLLREVRRGKF